MNNEDKKHSHTMKRCPFCGQEIHDDEIKCTHCGGWRHFAEPFLANIIAGGSNSKLEDLLDNFEVPTFLRKSIQAFLERKQAA